MDLLEQAIAGRGTVLTITGEAGIGKSRLLDALVEAAHERGAGVLRGAGRSDGRDVAYGAWRDAARELFPDRSEPLVAPLLGLRARDAELTPGLRVEALRDLRRRADPRPRSRCCSPSRTRTGSTIRRATCSTGWRASCTRSASCSC